jgi:hypothetical protein
LKISDFLHDWSRGLPVVIANVLLQGTWDPQYFIDAFGEEGATIVNCETGQTKKIYVKEYFGWFLNPDERTGIWKLKVGCPWSFYTIIFQHIIFACCVQDWPPQQDFQGLFPELFAAFCDAVPCPDMARLNGALNLAAHLPINGPFADLGDYPLETSLVA